MVVFRAIVVVTIMGVGCSKPNPAFDQDADDGTRGDDDTGKDSGDDSVDTHTSVDASADDGTAEETGIVNTNTTEPTTAGSDDLATTDGVESSTGSRICADLTDYDWTVDVLQGGEPAALDCDIPFEAIGIVSAADDGQLVVSDCGDCICATPRGEYGFEAPGLLPADHFPVGECARVVIDWSTEENCRPIGFVAFSDAAMAGRVQVVAGQDVETLPTAVGGAPIVVTPAETCECPECCPETGTLALGFAGVSIPQGQAADVDEFLDNTDSFFVEVYEAHSHEDCSRSLAWAAVLNLE